MKRSLLLLLTIPIACTLHAQLSITCSELPVSMPLNGPALEVDRQLNITGVDSLDGFIVSVSSHADPADELDYYGVLPANIQALPDPSTGTLLFTGKAAIEDWQDLMQTVTFRSSSSSTIPRIIRFSSGGSYATRELRLLEAQVLSTMGSVYYELRNDPKLIDNAIRVYAADSVSDARVEIASNYHPGDRLIPAGLPQGTTAEFDSLSGVLRLTGTLSPEQWQQVFRGIRFYSSSRYIINRDIRFMLDREILDADGDQSFPSATRAMLITIVLPVEGLRFDVQPVPAGVRLHWTTEAESGCQGFVVQHSSDGRQFTDLQMIPAAGNSSQARSYETIDPTPGAGLHYYRLRQLDAIDQGHFSEIRTIRVDAGIPRLSVYPNPTGGLVSILLPPGKRTRLELLDLSGKIVRSLPPSSGQVRLDLSTLAPGIYLLRQPDDSLLPAVKLLVR